MSLDLLHRKDLFKEAAFWGGSWRSGNSDRRISVSDPATLKVIGSVPSLGQKETLEAIRTSVDAFQDWSRRTAKERSILIRNWADL
ncbi:aldehyde dehydrogenase family protein, partial [Leptospira kmetyi]